MEVGNGVEVGVEQFDLPIQYFSAYEDHMSDDLQLVSPPSRPPYPS